MFYSVEFSTFALEKDIFSLKSIIFFNKNQQRYSNNIAKTIEESGDLEIVVSANKKVHVVINGQYSKNLFVYDGNIDSSEILGGLVFIEKNESLVIKHIFVRPECSEGGEWADQLVSIRLINKLFSIFRYKKKFIYLPYKKQKISILLKLIKLVE